MHRPRHQLTDRRFFIALFLLGLNDHLLKFIWPEWFTGKLSDVAGVFAFAWFLCALFPEHMRRTLVGVAIFFVWWKSPLSQPAIDAWNQLAIFSIGRVCDPTDLIALFVLPFVALCSTAWASMETSMTVWSRTKHRYVTLGISIMALVLFTATSRVRSFRPMGVLVDKTWSVPVPERVLWRHLDAIDTGLPLDTVRTGSTDAGLRFYDVQHLVLDGDTVPSIHVTVWGKERRTHITLGQVILAPRREAGLNELKGSYYRHHYDAFRAEYKDRFWFAVIMPLKAMK